MMKKGIRAVIDAAVNHEIAIAEELEGEDDVAGFCECRRKPLRLSKDSLRLAGVTSDTKGSPLAQSG